MHNIEITFHDNTDFEQQKTILKKINAWDSVESAQLVMPESTDEKIKRMAFVLVKNNADVDQVLKQLKRFSEINSPVIPPKRYSSNY